MSDVDTQYDELAAQQEAISKALAASTDDAARAALRKQLQETTRKLNELGRKSSKSTRQIASVVAGVMRKALGAQRAEMETLIEKRLEGALYWRGTYSADAEYGPGDLVQAKGTVWVTEDGATGKPGEPGSGWRMLVKTKTGGRHADD